jgi:hypothetical protein
MAKAGACRLGRPLRTSGLHGRAGATRGLQQGPSGPKRTPDREDQRPEAVLSRSIGPRLYAGRESPPTVRRAGIFAREFRLPLHAEPGRRQRPRLLHGHSGWRDRLCHRGLWGSRRRGEGTDGGPRLLLADHIEGQDPTLVHRVESVDVAIAELEHRGLRPEARFGIPRGPCATLVAPGGQRLAIYELTRPEADAHFAGRFDFEPSRGV